MNVGRSNSIYLTNAIHYAEQVATGEVPARRCVNRADAIRRRDADWSGRLIFILLINMLMIQVSGGYIIHQQVAQLTQPAMDTHAN